MAARETLDPIDVAVAESSDVSAEQVSDPDEPADLLKKRQAMVAGEARSQKVKNPWRRPPLHSKSRGESTTPYSEVSFR